MKFRHWIIFLFSILIFIGPDHVSAQEQQSIESKEESTLDRYMDDLGLEELNQYWDKVVENYGNYLPESKRGTLVEFVKGDKSSSMQSWVNGILAFIIQEISLNLKLLGTLMLLTIFSVFLQSLHNAFEQGAVSKVAYSIIFMVLIIIALNSFRVASEYAIEAIDNMSQFIMALLPCRCYWL